MFSSIEEIRQRFAEQDYICSTETATVVYLAVQLKKPLLVEGPAGVGKTELAKVLAVSQDLELIRMQCYEGLDESKALYEWEYAKQLLYTQIVKAKIEDVLSGSQTLSEAVERIAAQDDAFFSERFIQPRPLLQAIYADEPVVLLIDEVDKSDPEFEAFLLEILSDFQISIPELGTRQALHRPFVVLTSNNFRDMSDALKRRCLHLYIDYPGPETERAIVARRVPELPGRLADQMIDAMAHIRQLDLKKKPSISETLDWARALISLQLENLSQEAVIATLNVICKYREDAEQVRREVEQVVNFN